METGEIKLQTVDLSDWVQSGEGWYAITYFHRTDRRLHLKLNVESMSYEDALAEFKRTRAAYELGVECPVTLQLVTDGSRYGIITERLEGKKSFARILSEHPEMMDSLARELAEAAHRLHSMPCDNAVCDSVPERMRTQINSCKWIKGKVRAALNSYADGMRPVGTCLHGDMHPGNYLRSDAGDLWIDLGRFGYGDPDLDYASQYILAYLTPKAMTKWVLHVDQAGYRRFVELFGLYYYGEDYHSPETQERLRRAVSLMLGTVMTKTPAAVLIFGSYVLGKVKVTQSIIRVLGLFVRK